MLPLKVPIVAMSHSENSYCSPGPKSGCDVITGDDERLLVGWECEDWNPGGKDVSERVHLNGPISYRSTKWTKKRQKGR